MKALIADDDAITRRLLESSLKRWGYDVVIACDGLEASGILQQADAPRLAIVDWQMPGIDGIELCRQLRRDRGDEYAYVLLLTANHAKNQIIEGLEAGADDYITKPFDPQELRVRLRNGKRILQLLEQLTAAREVLRDMAARDPLTNLWNHNAIIELLGRELQRAQRQQSSMAVVLLDLDHFKRINDTYGHLAGDRVLCHAAEVMRHCIRPYDAVGRYGGEEFLLVLPGCDAINAISHGERIRMALSGLEVEADGGPIQFTASAGVAVLDADGVADPYAAIKAADAALYAAKRRGRNRVELAEPSMMLAALHGVHAGCSI